MFSYACMQLSFVVDMRAFVVDIKTLRFLTGWVDDTMTRCDDTMTRCDDTMR